MFEQLINNPWVISLVSGLITGMLGYAFTMAASMRRRARHRKTAVKNGNAQIIDDLQTFSKSGDVPKPEVIEALIEATAMAYEIPKESLFTIGQVYQAFAKRALEDSDITPESKRKLSIEAASMAAKTNTDNDRRSTVASSGFPFKSIQPHSTRAKETREETADDYAVAIPVALAAAIFFSLSVFAILIAIRFLFDSIPPTQAVVSMALMLIASIVVLGIFIAFATALIYKKRSTPLNENARKNDTSDLNWRAMEYAVVSLDRDAA